MALNFLKKGKDAQVEMQQAEQSAQAAKEQQKYRRYWMPEGQENQITFLDGNLMEDGLMDTVTYMEHQEKLNGHYRNWFPCVGETEPCPICQIGHHPSLVAIFTVIDHSEYTDKQGETHKDERRLYVVKRETFMKLQRMAMKRGGLRGVVLDVARIGERSPNVGSDFDFIKKLSDDDLASQYPGNSDPFNYEDAIRYYSAAEMRKLGFGTSIVGSDGDAASPSGSALPQDGGVESYQDEL